MLYCGLWLIFQFRRAEDFTLGIFMALRFFKMVWKQDQNIFSSRKKSYDFKTEKNNLKSGNVNSLLQLGLG
jgi:hypothetical protein